jgi:hypothetical protein
MSDGYFKLPKNDSSTNEDKVQQPWPSSDEGSCDYISLDRRSGSSTRPTMTQTRRRRRRRRRKKKKKTMPMTQRRRSLQPSGRGRMILALVARNILRFSSI